MKPAKLFHAIVVVGASVAGCGDDTDRTATDAGRTTDAMAAIDAAMSDDAGGATDGGGAMDAGEEDGFVAIL